MNRDFLSKIFRRTIGLGILVILFFFFFMQDFKGLALGYIFGTSISMTNFMLLKLSVEKSVRMAPDGAHKYAKNQYFLRMFIYGLVLVIAAKADYLNFLAVFMGILSIKFVIVFSNILDKDFLK